ncbi:uncharacterized protein LOC132203566 [Neocloeon triangulifer]|uniref:uncharacterized protein LOC132203566 n=1 Tax=Neocloeon triangulifer TaxID=2078957 RepID=UPI00286F31E1|nr:uncharacterized protein LOC132203566 [Neocloeon triangulifer]
MLKHMLTPASPGPRAQPVDLLGMPRPNHHPRGGHPLNLSLQSHHSGRLNHSHLSTLSTSKHSLGGNSSSVSPGTAPLQPSLALVHSTTLPPVLAPPPPIKMANGGLHLARRVPPSATQISREPTPNGVASGGGHQPGVREMMTSLGLLCLVSLLLALLALIFLLKISPAAEVAPRGGELSAVTFEEYVVVYEVTLALCALTLSLNLCCLLVCAIQFLFAVKLARSAQDGERTNKYLQKSSVTRICAVGGFFVSIPVFLTGIILYTFIQFHSTPAIITSIFIGLGIIFCGCAMVHNVFVWQREKTNAVKALAQQQRQLSVSTSETTSGGDSRGLHLSLRQDTPVIPGSPNSMPAATLDLSALVLNPHELSTLV